MSAKEAYAKEMRKLILKREIQKISGELVEDAEELLENTQLYQNKEFKENQIRNVINVAAGSGSVPVVTNFIKYQIGRHKEWQHKDFGETLIKKLDKLEGNAGKLIRRVDQETKGLQETDVDEEAREVWLELVRHYLGYLNRYFKYQQAAKGEGGGNG